MVALLFDLAGERAFDLVQEQKPYARRHMSRSYRAHALAKSMKFNQLYKRGGNETASLLRLIR